MEKEDFLKRIRESKKSITLFIGAGINPPSVPRWNALLDTLLDKAIRRILSDFDYSETLSDIRDYMKNNFTVYERGNFISNGLGTDYMELLYDEIYNNLNYEQYEDSNSTLSQVAELCLNQRIQAVVTYNWDSYLEEKIMEEVEKRNFDWNVESLFGDKLKPIDKNCLPVYHVHGFIPWKTCSLDDLENNIVFGLDEYHKLFYQPSNWQLTTQLYFLQHNTCIFLGTSLNDMNMLRLLATSNHYSQNDDVYIIRSYIHEESNLLTTKTRQEIIRKHFEFLKINLVNIDVSYSDYSNIVNLIKELQGEIHNG